MPPLAPTISHDEMKYTSPMNAIAMYVARGTERFGSLASSPKIAVASNPRNDVKANMNAIPTEPLKMLLGSIAATGSASVPLSIRIARSTSSSSAVSAISRTASTRALSSTPTTPRPNAMPRPISDRIHQAMWMCSSESSV